jgi:hypothetical protein
MILLNTYLSSKVLELWTIQNSGTSRWSRTPFYRCVGLSKIRFIEGDTYSLYYAVSGNPDEYSRQAFKHVIKDEDF